MRTGEARDVAFGPPGYDIWLTLEAFCGRFFCFAGAAAARGWSARCCCSTRWLAAIRLRAGHLLEQHCLTACRIQRLARGSIGRPCRPVRQATGSVCFLLVLFVLRQQRHGKQVERYGTYSDLRPSTVRDEAPIPVVGMKVVPGDGHGEKHRPTSAAKQRGPRELPHLYL